MMVVNLTGRRKDLPRISILASWVPCTVVTPRKSLARGTAQAIWGSWLKRKYVSQTFESSNQLRLQGGALLFFVVVGAELKVVLLAVQMAVGNDQDGVSDRQGNSLLAASRRQSTEQRERELLA